MSLTKPILLVLGGIILLIVEAVLFMFPGNETVKEPVNIAVSSNFTDAMKALAQGFEEKTGDKVVLSFGSTGKLYAQIKNGAPFDVFFAADVEHAKLLDAENITLTDSRFTYAIGRIALWSTKPDFVDKGGSILESDKFQHLAVSNPELAPYGKAAQEVLQGRNLWETLQTKLVLGQNTAQTYQFVESGNAELGFVAYSQLLRDNRSVKGSYRLLPQSLHSPIKQQAVIMTDTMAVKSFTDFVRSREGAKIITKFGYGLP